MILIPSNKQWVQTNKSDVLGSLVGSFNLDLTTVLGKTRITRTLKTMDTTVVSGFSSAPYAFKYYIASTTPYVYALAGNTVFRSTATVSTPLLVDSFVALSSHPTTCDHDYNDMETFDGSLYMTSGGAAACTLYKSDGATSTATPAVTTFGANGPYMLCAYADRLYISLAATAGPAIYSLTTAGALSQSGDYTLATFPKDYVITFMRAATSKIWIGLLSKYTGKGYVWEWDGAKSSSTRVYRLESQGPLACVIKDDIPWIVDSNGRLLVFSGGTFVEVARLPLNNKYLKNATTLVNNRFIHPNGMSLVNGRINFLINNQIADNGSTINEFCPSGIWEYNENIGLYHKYSLSYTPTGSNTITDYGQNRISVAGALAEMKINDTSAKMTGFLIAGADVYTNASATTSAAFVNDTFDAVSGTTGQYATQAYGYLVTTKIESQNIQDTWQKLFVKYKKLLTSSDFIVVKYRTTDPDPTEISITWTSTTTFTTTTNILGKEGYEVEFLQGVGSGQTAHITTIDSAAGTYTVHLDTAITGATGTAKARLQNWTKSTILADQTSQFKEFPIIFTSPWIQLKICMAFTGRGEMDGALLVNTPYQPAK